MTVKDLLNIGISKLKENKIEDSTRIARILLSYFLKQTKEKLWVIENQEVTQKSEIQFLEAIEKVINGIPLQYITNTQEFMKLKFYVDENVLIPQPDTEILVEEIIGRANGKNKILDLCTGSGAIAVAFASYTQTKKIVGIDISEKAIEIAKRNAIANKVKCDFFVSDMFEKINEKFDIIVSNPPYIVEKVIETLDENVKKEPHIALNGGIDGLDFYRIITKEAYKYLNDKGIVAVEIGYDQKEAVIKLFEETEEYEDIFSKKDLAGNDRIVVAVKK